MVEGTFLSLGEGFLLLLAHQADIFQQGIPLRGKLTGQLLPRLLQRPVMAQTETGT